MLIMSSSSATRLRIASAGRFFTRIPKPMLLATLMFGNSAYDWNTMPTFRLFGGRFVMSLPSTLMLPESGYSKPAIMRSVVVLPQPDGPRNEMNSPRSADSSKSSTAVKAPNDFLTWSSARNPELVVAHQWAPPISTRLRVSRPTKAMPIIANQVSPKLMIATAAGW